MEYLGSLGRMVGLSCPSSERVQSAPRYVTSMTVEGRRRAQVRPASPRTWDIGLGLASPQELATLSAFVSGAWGAGPFHWVPVQAWKHNLLTPREAMMLDRRSNGLWAEGGPVIATDGTLAPRSMLSDRTETWDTLFVDIPCIPGVPVTWSADVAGDGSSAPGIASAFYTAAPEQIGVGLMMYGSPTAGLQRVSQLRVPPENAVSMRVGIPFQTKRITRPQVTWTDHPVPFAPGHGCRSAVIDAASEDLIAANSFGTWSSTSFTVMEVS